MNAGFSNLTALKARSLSSEMAAKSQFDDTIRSIGLGVANQFETRANRRFSRVVDRAEKHAMNGQVIAVNHFPIESVDSVTFLEAGRPIGETQTLEVERFSEEAGLVYIPYWARRNDTVIVTYTGGYWWDTSEAGDQSIPSGATPIPDDLFDAWITQVQAVIEARNIFGGQSAGTNEKQSITTRDIAMSEYVSEVIQNYRRH